MKRRAVTSSARSNKKANRRRDRECSDEEDCVPSDSLEFDNSNSDSEEKPSIGVNPNSTGKSKAAIIEETDGVKTDYKGKGKAPVVETGDNDEDMNFNVDDSTAVHDHNRVVNPISAKKGKVRVYRRIKNKNKRWQKNQNGEDDRPLQWEIWEEENKKWLDSEGNKDEDVENTEQDEISAEMMDPPPDLLLPLLRFQKEWLAWGLKQEMSEMRGGILADEMGMGKTIQAISLVLTARVTRPMECVSRECSTLPETKCTLVICPVVAVIQWVSEISKFTAEGSTKVLVYHGAKRSKELPFFSDYDFVLTTYSTVEAEYRKHIMPPKERCQWCQKLFYPEKIATHLRYFCGPDAVKTSKLSKQEKKKGRQAPGSTNSKPELSNKEKDVTNEIKVIMKKGKRKSKNHSKQSKRIRVCDSNDDSTHTGQDSPMPAIAATKTSVLYSVKWERIILDEAHYIKRRRCNTAKAIFALESTYKWALSGTPLQTRVGELYSLIRFLQMYPYSYYFCKNCDCKSLDYSLDNVLRKCGHCTHSSLRHFCWWNKYVAKPVKRYGYVGDGRKAMMLLRHKLLKSMVLRRTKKGRAADLAIPPRTTFLRRDRLDNKEEDFYEALYTQSQSQFNTYVAAGTLMNNYAHIFELLTRLRQALDHPYLVIYSGSSPSQIGSKSNDIDQDCGICHDPAEDPVVTSCEHVFCKACLVDFSSTLGQVSCPSCSKPVDLSTKKNPRGMTNKMTTNGYKRLSILNQIHLPDFQTSTKIEALKEEIRSMVERDHAAKAIVFSQFTSFLDLMKYSLQQCGVNCAQLVGSMRLAAREDAIKRFTDDPECRIFLMSLKAGGVALNLTVASHVFLMDPWWNPAVERQAQDRIHRIGQYKPIRIVRFVIENTIEERILRLQEKKELVLEGTMGCSSEALGRVMDEDIRFLFQKGA